MMISEVRKEVQSLHVIVATSLPVLTAHCIQGVPKKMGFGIVFIFAPKIIFKVTPILLDIQLPYSKVILSHLQALCHYWLVFYGYFSLGGLGYF